MSFFFIWSGIVFLLIGVICLVVWKTHAQVRFRSKLILTFLLFVAIPVIPLTYMTASLLTGSARVLLPDTIGEALNCSLNCLRTQFAEKGERFFEAYSDNLNSDPQTLKAFDIQSMSLFKIDPDTVTLIRHTGSSDHWDKFLEPQDILQRFCYGTSSRLIKNKHQEWFCLYRAQTDSTILVLKYPIDPKMAQSRRKIETALIMVNTLSMIRESVMQKKIIWVLAVFWIIGLICLAWVASQRLSGEMTRPIRALVNGMEQVASGNLEHQVQTKANDEFKYLVDRFNAMTKDLRDTRERLLQAERLAAWQAVARQISHEIKNSLTPISISLHRIKKQLGPSIPSKIKSSMQTIEEEMRMLQNMAAEFSNFARMPEPTMENIQINEIARTALQLLKHSHHAIRFHESFDSDIPTIIADRDQMKRMLNNLLKNAVEALDETGDIWIKTETVFGDKKIRLEIRDSGKGMDENARSHIFQPYFTTKKGGTGLGMAMVRQIIESHNGSIHISSYPGKGTTVTIQLPT
ncbi:HAMP domain-containing protein [bacterium]|nr:HAMP domain-containing protein [bacterium]